MSFLKKIFSVLLTLAMVISVAAYSAPAMASGVTVESIAIDEVIVDQNNIYVTYGPDGKPYIRYRFDITYRAVMSNNATVYGTGTSFTYDGDEHQIAIKGSTQDQVEWKPGNVYNLVAIVDRTVTDEFRVIVSGPDVTVDFKDMFVIENYSGYEDYDVNGDPMFHYRVYPRFTATLADGTFIDDGLRSTYVYIDGHEYQGVAYDPQREHPWSVGNTYRVAASFMGVYGTYNVTVMENPVDLVSVEDIELTYQFGGYTDWEGHYIYSIFPQDYVVYFKDGTRARPNEDGLIFWNDETYFLDLHVTGAEMDAWQAGKQYTINGDFMGYPVNILVNVRPNVYNALLIAGKDNLAFRFKKSAGADDVFHVKAIQNGPVDPAKKNVLPAYVLTEEGVFMYADFVFPSTVDVTDDYMFDDPFYVVVDGLVSNTLSGCRWLTRFLCPAAGGPDGDADGDADGDGSLGMRDVLLIRRVIAGLDELTPEALDKADIDRDGILSAKDVLKIRRKIAGLDD